MEFWRKSALAILLKSQINSIHDLFTDLFNPGEIDMLYPFGENKYLSINTDDYLENTSQGPIPSSTPTLLLSLQHLKTSLDGTLLVSGEIEVIEDDELMLTFKEQLVNKSSIDSPLAATCSHVD